MIERSAQATAPPLPYNKVCEVEDFANPDLRNIILEVFSSQVRRFGSDFPASHPIRKHWEVAMSIRAMRDSGVLHSHAEVLGVGAGNEPTIFWLTQHVKRVFATDLYLPDSGSASRDVTRWLRAPLPWRHLIRSAPTLAEIVTRKLIRRRTQWGPAANPVMLVQPETQWHGPWNPRRLVVQHMNALDLRYEDDSFDAIFSSSSLEHFGTLEDVQRSVDEMWRVLRPGGLLTLSTEFRIAGSARCLPGTLMFTRPELETIFGRSTWTRLGPELDVSVSALTRASSQDFVEVTADWHRHAARHGQVLVAEVEWSAYPHVVLRFGNLAWTSIHLALTKSP